MSCTCMHILVTIPTYRHCALFCDELSGGFANGEDLLSTEIYEYDPDTRVESVTPGLDLPRMASGHCLLKVNTSSNNQEYVFLGGYPYSTEVHHIDLNEEEPTWRNLAAMPDSKKGAFCGYVESLAGERKIIMAAGTACRSNLHVRYHVRW